MALKSGEEPPTPLPHTPTCGFIPEEPEKVIKHNEDLCRTKWAVSAGERAGKALNCGGLQVQESSCDCVCVSVCPPHLPLEKPSRWLRFLGIHFLSVPSVSPHVTQSIANLILSPFCQTANRRSHRRSCGYSRDSWQPICNLQLTV